jgi:hypothetical protein
MGMSCLGTVFVAGSAWEASQVSLGSPGAWLQGSGLGRKGPE